MDSLRAITAGHPVHASRAALLDSLVAARMDGMERGLRLRRQAGLDSAALRVASGRGRGVMERIRAVVGEMERDEALALQERVLEARHSERRVRLVAGLGALLMLLGLAGGLVRLHSDLRRLQSTEAALRESRARLEGYAAELERSNRELQEFAYVASHDLQEPLRKIVAFGDRLQQHAGDALDVQGRDYLVRMQGAAGRMQALIEDLLALSRVSSRPPAVQRVELDAVAREVVSDLQARMEATGGEVAIEPLPAVRGDPTQMRQLLQNLVGNALKFHRPDAPPRVRLRAEPAGGAARILVADEGIGIDPKHAERIFEPFQRLHGRFEYEGTGMGLAICRKIARRHGGSIAVESGPGRGSTFVVTLPLAAAGETR